MIKPNTREYDQLENHMVLPLTREERGWREPEYQEDSEEIWDRVHGEKPKDD